MGSFYVFCVNFYSIFLFKLTWRLSIFYWELKVLQHKLIHLWLSASYISAPANLWRTRGLLSLCHLTWLFLFFRPNYGVDWETCVSVPDFSWKQIAEPVMKLYTETTDGSTIETKESALVWNFQYADPDFGSCQAKELLDHLESVLANEPVSVKSGPNIVEVKPQVSGFLL